MIPFIVLAVVLVALVLWFVGAYNRLVKLRNQSREGWAGIDVQLQRRADLVPNLVDTVKGYAAHETEVFDNITSARAALAGAQGPKETEAAATAFDSALRGLLAVAEDHPELRASDNFVDLQRQLSEIENELSLARRYYNATVEDLNTAIETIPTNIVAGIAGFDQAEYFRATSDASVAPRVSFDD